MKFFKHRIKQIDQETDKAISLVFENEHNFKFLPGQYITVEKEINDETLRRSYSLSSSPDEDLRIGIKAIDQGVFSNHALTLNQGDELLLSAPEGMFTLDPKEEVHQDYLAIAAGSGITPIMSMIKSVLKEDNDVHFYLIYGNRTPSEAMYLSELEKLSKETGRLHIFSSYSRNCGPTDRLGRIDGAWINFVFNKSSFSKIFLCGPQELVDFSREHLLDKGVSKDKILSELFFIANTKDEGIKMEGKSSMSLVLDDEEHGFSFDKEVNLLDAVLNEGYDAPYSCKGGACSSCIALVTKGSAKMKNNSLLTDSEIAEGYVLTCQAYAETEEICVNFDEA